MHLTVTGQFVGSIIKEGLQAVQETVHITLANLTSWSMRVAGRPAPIVGRVCMDSCMIDITDIPGVGEGDEVTVFSAEPGNDLETMARVLDTIPYEIMTSVSSRVKRIYLKE